MCDKTESHNISISLVDQFEDCNVHTVTQVPILCMCCLEFIMLYESFFSTVL